MRKVFLISLLLILIVSCGKKGDPYPKNTLHDNVKSGKTAKR
jgi:hypothetical protein